MIGGAADIRANNASRYELAEASARLGTIYGIRVDIYRRKFFVKFLNNFLAQITPFFFYAIGGYFAIKGQLSVGALVAVVAAYKDIIDPWKELLKWYETKEDVRVKYEQIVSQFEPEGILPPAMFENAPSPLPRLAGPLVANNLTYVEEGEAVVEPLSITVKPGERVALVGDGTSGKNEVALRPRAPGVPLGGQAQRGDAGSDRRARRRRGHPHRVCLPQCARVLGNADAQPALRPHAPPGQAGRVRG